MTTIIAAKALSVIIGTQDWSDWVTEFTTGYTELDDGLIEIEAKLTLSLPANFNALPSDPRYELNPTQWARGQSVQVQVRNDSGTFANHPCGKLYILDEPTDAEINSDFAIQLGCAISLNNFREPDSDVSGVQIGVSTPRHTVIGRILDAAQIPHSLTSISGSFDYPLPKRGGGYAEQAGTLARAVNQFLYCDSSGTARNTAIDFAQAAYLSLEVGKDETIWEPSKGNEIPVEELIVSGVAYDLINPNLGSTTTLVEYGTVGEFLPGNNQPYRSVIKERKTIIDYGYDPVTRRQRVVTTIEKPFVAAKPPKPSESGGNVSNLGGGIIADPLRLITVTTTDDLSWFDNLGRIFRREIRVSEPITLVYTENPSTAPIQTKEEIITWKYSSDNLVESIDSETREVGIRVSPNDGVFKSMRFSESYQKNWREDPPKSGIWVATERYRVAWVRVNPDVVQPYAPASDPSRDDIVQRGNTPDLQPPAVEYRNPDRSQKERQIKAAVLTQPLAGGGFVQRKRPISVEGCTSNEQLYQYGLIFNRLIVGRRFGRRIGFRVSDAWLSSSVKPLMRVDAVYKGATYKLLLDGLTYSHTQTESYIVANGILIEANGVQLVNPLLRAQLAANVGACSVAAEGEVSGNVLLATCGICELAATAYAYTDPGAIDFRIDLRENSLTLGVL
ncbi:hypothetical protein [Pseudanabaena sp. PCC 6802]|uniref:hypothetical protein n=1 Tax=Pseudanabaena sp. PCC 6802 TaxID=118173 RepID=UPI00034C383A|nr:hypothetical protein [Pseudanabaena sp. PCC 6802]